MSDPYAPPGVSTIASATSERPTVVRYHVLTMLTAAAAIAYIARNAVGVAESSIREDLGLTLEQSGWFMGTFFWSYAVLQIPGAWLAHRHGSKVAVITFVCGWSLAALFIGLAPALWMLLIGQLIMGAAQAGIFPAACHSISHWIPLARQTFACGVLAMGMQVGAIAAGLLTGKLIEETSWRAVFVVYAIPGFLLAALLLKLFRNDPSRDARVNLAELKLIGAHADQTKSGKSTTEWAFWLRIVRQPAVWFLCGQQICRASGYMFFASWFPTFLQTTRGVSVENSGYLQALVFAGTLTGCLTGGLLTDWIWKRTGNLRLSRSAVGSAFLFGCGALILAAWFVKGTLLAVTLLSVGALFAALAGPCALSATIDIGGDRVAQVFALMNMMGNLAAAACPILVAKLFAQTSNWGLVLLVFAGIYFAGAVCWAMVRFDRRGADDRDAV